MLLILKGKIIIIFSFNMYNLNNETLLRTISEKNKIFKKIKKNHYKMLKLFVEKNEHDYITAQA